MRLVCSHTPHLFQLFRFVTVTAERPASAAAMRNNAAETGNCGVVAQPGLL